MPKNDIEAVIAQLEHHDDFKRLVRAEVEMALFKQSNKDCSSKGNSQDCMIPEIEFQEEEYPARRSTTRRRSFLAGAIDPTQKVELEHDLFSMMLLSKVFSSVWLLGLISFTIQITLGIFILMDQSDRDFGSTPMSIPKTASGRLRVGQVLAIMFSIMSQTDLLTGLRSILILSHQDKATIRQIFLIENNDNILETQDENRYDCFRIRIFLPNILKMLQGALILATSFVVIIQSDNTVDVLKDFSALFVVSSVDDMFFYMTDSGYFGFHLEKIANEVKLVKLVKEKEFENSNRKFLKLSFISIAVSLIMGWVYITGNQIKGTYTKEAYPLCSFNEDKDTTLLRQIGDGTCQYAKGSGTNILECGWDGGDCTLINERYPNCAVDDFAKLGNNECEKDRSYNTKACGFDDGDCVEENKDKRKKNYPNCPIDYIGWIGDNHCDGRHYASSECENDGGDCANCKVDDMSKIGNGHCDTGVYNTAECSYDGGDCVELNKMKKQKYVKCTVENIGWIGDGVCNGGIYMTTEGCDNDGGDCDRCTVLNSSNVGDGKCHGGEYNTKECSFDGGDCFFDNSILQKRYKNCIVQNPYWIGDGKCHGGEYNTKECGFDGNDCINFNKDYPDCVVEHPSKVGDNFCDRGEYLTIACGFDGGDCGGKECLADFPSWVGDGFCDGVEYLTEACDFDGGDCDKCIVADQSIIGNGICNGKEYNTEECNFDGGDCVDLNEQIQRKYPGCSVENIGWIGDGICDGFNYMSDECRNDGGDCSSPCNVDDLSLIADGYCDEGKYNVDGCLFDGYDCVPMLETIGDSYHDSWKWIKGITGADGYIYSMPLNANQILKMDPNSTSSSTSLVGDDVGYIGTFKWWGGVKGLDNIIYGVPFFADSILSFNTFTKETHLIAEGDPMLQSVRKFSGGVLAGNGFIYFIPFFNKKVIKFDTSNNTRRLMEIGDNVGEDTNLIVGGVLGSDGNVYGIPFNSRKVFKIDVENDTTSFVGDFFDGQDKWYGGVLAKDGNIYACPYSANHILQINTQNRTTLLVGPDLGGASRKWSALVEGVDGFLFGIPLNSNKLLRFDPIDHTATLIQLDSQLLGDSKWAGGVLGGDGYIYGIPLDAPNVLSIAPLSHRP